MMTDIKKILKTIQERIKKNEDPKYDEIPYEIKTEKSFILEVLKIEASSAPSSFRSFYTELVPLFGYGSNLTLNTLMADQDIINAAIKASLSNVEYIPEEKMSLKIAKYAAKNGFIYLLPKEFQNNVEVYNIFIGTIIRDPYYFYSVDMCDNDLLNKVFVELVNRSFDLTSDENIRYTLIRIIPKLNKDAIKYLTKINPLYIKYSPFNDDEETVLYFLQYDWNSFINISERLKTNKKFVKKAMNVNAKIWTHIPNELTLNPEIYQLKDKLFEVQNIQFGEWGEYI